MAAETRFTVSKNDRSVSFSAEDLMEMAEGLLYLEKYYWGTAKKERATNVATLHEYLSKFVQEVEHDCV